MSEHAPSQAACTAGPRRITSPRSRSAPLRPACLSCLIVRERNLNPSTRTHGHHQQLRCPSSRNGLVHHEPRTARQAARTPAARAQDRRPPEGRRQNRAREGELTSPVYAAAEPPPGCVSIFEKKTPLRSCELRGAGRLVCRDELDVCSVRLGVTEDGSVRADDLATHEGSSVGGAEGVHPSGDITGEWVSPTVRGIPRVFWPSSISISDDVLSLAVIRS